MPPRIPLFPCLKAPNVHHALPSPRSFTSSTPVQASTVTQRRKHRDPYAIAQAKARKAANLSRQDVLKKERAAALGDPVRGITTPYIESFDTALPPETLDQTAQGAKSGANEHLNFRLSTEELQQGVQRSKWLNTPSTPPVDDDSRFYQGPSAEEQVQARERGHTTATEALRRISSMALGSGADRLRANKQRCIADFGRHNTDSTLAPKAAASTGRPASLLEKTPRAGPDTGSSEVQVAILTAKIRSLSEFLGGRGRMDKANKRNLALLVHRRQKHLRYLRRKERGGPRWQHLIETLGLTEGTWQGEISM